MNTLAALAPYVHALGWSLLHFLWQGALIGLLYAALRGSCAGCVARHRLGMFCLVAMFVCLAATLALLWPGEPEIVASGAAATGPSPAWLADAAERGGLPANLEGLLPWCVGAWLAGVCAIALRSFVHWRRVAATVRSAVPLPRDWQLRLIELSQHFGILRPVRLLSSLDVAAPTLIGWLKPTILLPASLLTGFAPAQIELIIAHELAHVRRFDYLANLVQVVVETLLFYHPAVHWIGSDVRQQREQCCDDLVLSVGGGQRVAYARTLADLEEWMQREADRGFGMPAPALGADGGVLLARVRRIVDPLDARRMAAPRGSGLTPPVLLACAGLLLALLRLNSSAVDAVGAALARASATSAELLAAATFRIRVEAPVLPPPGRPAIVVPTLPGVLRDAAPPPPAARSGAAETEVARVVPPPPREAAAVAPAPALAAVAEEPRSAAATAEAPAVAPPVPVAPAGPRPLHVVPPAYPLDALRNGVAGKVDLEFQVGDDGRVRNVRVLGAQPSGRFEQAAIAALRQWRFASPSAPADARYTRSFAFTPGAAPQEPCREITGSHICRRAGADGEPN